MKINIQKIAYRVIPFVTAFVILISCVVVGNPVGASAAETYVSEVMDDFYWLDNPSPQVDYSVLSLKPNSTFTACTGGGTRIGLYEWSEHEALDVTGYNQIWVYWPLLNKFYRASSDLGNVLDITFDTFVSSSANFVGTWERYANQIKVSYYDASGEVVCNSAGLPITQAFRGDVDYDVYAEERYWGMLNWPEAAAYFTLELQMAFSCDAQGEKYISLEYDEDGEFKTPCAKTYNMTYTGNMYFGPRFYYNLLRSGEEYSLVNMDMRSNEAYYLFRCGSTEETIQGSGLTVNFSPGETVELCYIPGFVLDINSAWVTSGTLLYDLCASWSTSSSTMDGELSVSAPNIYISYYDANLESLGSNIIDNSAYGTDYGSNTSAKTYDFYFKYPEGANYFMIWASIEFSADAAMDFFIELERFTFMWSRDSERFAAYMNGLSDPDLPVSDGPSIDASKFDIYTIVDAADLSAYTSVVKTLWTCDLLVSMLTLVVSLCLVSWVFFGKKG